MHRLPCQPPRRAPYSNNRLISWTKAELNDGLVDRHTQSVHPVIARTTTPTRTSLYEDVYLIRLASVRPAPLDAVDVCHQTGEGLLQCPRVQGERGRASHQQRRRRQYHLNDRLGALAGAEQNVGFLDEPDVHGTNPSVSRAKHPCTQG